MSTFHLKKAVSPFFLFSMIMAFAMTSANAKAARADYYDGPATCGSMCMAYGGTMFSPFMGYPQFPVSNGYGNYYQTGQIPDPRYLMEQQLVAASYRPMGLTYAPVVGADAIRINEASMALGF